MLVLPTTRPTTFIVVSVIRRYRFFLREPFGKITVIAMFTQQSTSKYVDVYCTYMCTRSYLFMHGVKEPCVRIRVQ